MKKIFLAAFSLALFTTGAFAQAETSPTKPVQQKQAKDDAAGLNNTQAPVRKLSDAEIQRRMAESEKRMHQTNTLQESADPKTAQPNAAPVKATKVNTTKSSKGKTEELQKLEK
ncbi:MAG: hypothetical protein IT240_05435 [Bacteroidia bacterium]|jgi:hypothetical protein|nr:hypothetical protein [Bacteroidia bacterium]MCC6768464.1 hypothetical protein [Bacteroidia bacterium]